LPWAGCTATPAPGYKGNWVGAQADRGHMLRPAGAAALLAPSIQRRVGVVVVGGGVSGLAAAQALSRAGVDDVHVLDLEDTTGGNSRAYVMGGMQCPLGAHYLPLPGERAVEVMALLESLGLRRTERGVPVYDERHLCHSPQERLYIAGHWHDGLLPPVDALPAAERASTLSQYRQFSLTVEAMRRSGAFSMPTARSQWSTQLDALDATTFAKWLDAHGLTATALRWYLDYCCRDDYGAGAAQVSAWAGLHYFASRHGFHVPGDTKQNNGESSEGVLTWPEGNAWIAQRMAAALTERVHTGMVALRVAEGLRDVSVDMWNTREQRAERWTAAQLVMAVPLFVAARLLESPPAALTKTTAGMHYAPWLVGNLHLAQALNDRPGAPPSWDNVVYQPASIQSFNWGSFSLGYVDAMHQSTRLVAGPTVLTVYWALGGNNLTQLREQRARLLNDPWSTWAQALTQDVAQAHPDLQAKLVQVDLMRYGHAMSIPVPNLRSSTGLRALAEPQRRVQFAHSDVSGYSVFEEALYQGVRAAAAITQVGLKKVRRS
jgi:monoamine oxidase